MSDDENLVPNRSRQGWAGGSRFVTTTDTESYRQVVHDSRNRRTTKKG